MTEDLALLRVNLLNLRAQRTEMEMKQTKEMG